MRELQETSTKSRLQGLVWVFLHIIFESGLHNLLPLTSFCFPFLLKVHFFLKVSNTFVYLSCLGDWKIKVCKREEWKEPEKIRRFRKNEAQLKSLNHTQLNTPNKEEVAQVYLQYFQRLWIKPQWPLSQRIPSLYHNDSLVLGLTRNPFIDKRLNWKVGKCIQDNIPPGRNSFLCSPSKQY